MQGSAGDQPGRPGGERDGERQPDPGREPRRPGEGGRQQIERSEQPGGERRGDEGNGGPQERGDQGDPGPWHGDDVERRREGEIRWNRGTSPREGGREVGSHTGGQRRPVRRDGRRRPCQRRASAGRGRGGAPTGRRHGELEAGREREVGAVEEEQDHRPAEGVSGGGRALGEEGQHGEDRHHRGAQEGRQRPHQQQVKKDRRQHQQQAERAAARQPGNRAARPAPPAPAQGGPPRRTSGDRRRPPAARASRRAAAPRRRRAPARGPAPSPGRSPLRPRGTPPPPAPAGRRRGAPGRPAGLPPPSAPGSSPAAARGRAATGDGWHSRESARGIPWRAGWWPERRRRRLGVRQVEVDLERRREQEIPLAQAHDTRRSGPSLVVRRPVPGDREDRLHRTLAVESGERIARKPQPHHGGEQAEGEKGQTDPRPPPEGEAGEGEQGEEEDGKVRGLKRQQGGRAAARRAGRSIGLVAQVRSLGRFIAPQET